MHPRHERKKIEIISLNLRDIYERTFKKKRSKRKKVWHVRVERVARVKWRN